MRIAFHVFSPLGAGHLQRARALGDALAPHELIWLAHRPVGAAGVRLPDHVALTLPDRPDGASFQRLAMRGQQVAAWLRQEPPDLIVTEHYPLGRRNLDPGLGPVLQAAKAVGVPVVASVRDLMGKSREHLGWAQQGLAVANAYFSAILWHGDADFLPFDFPYAADLRPPVLPTGYVRHGAAPAWQPEPRHWVASCGSGRRGGMAFCLAALGAQSRLQADGWRLTLVCGQETWAGLQGRAEAALPGVTLLPWTPDLPALLATAAVSVSQCGYNTFIETVGGGMPALFVPHVEPDDDEQALRATALARYPGYAVLPAADPRLAGHMAEGVAALAGRAAAPPALAMTGAARSAELVQTF